MAKSTTDTHNLINMNYEDLTIGSRVFLVHKVYVEDKRQGGRILVCRVKSFCNLKGKIFPVYSEVGKTNHSPDASVHYVYKDIKKAINAIRTEPKHK